MLYENMENEEINTMLASVIEDIPVWTLLLWIPQIISITYNTKYALSKAFSKAFYKLGIYFPQVIYYAYKQFKQAEQKPLATYSDVRKVHYNLIGKLENMVNLLTNLPCTSNSTIPITYIGSFTRCFS